MTQARFALAIAMGLAGSAACQTSSTFDADLEGWTSYADGAISFDPSAGNPGGAARIADFGSGSYFGFDAPDAFLGDKSACFGGLLRFDIRTNNSTSAGSTQPDVEIRGGGITIELDLEPPPGGQWVSRAIPLSSGADWRLNSLGGAAASDADIQAVLADVTLLRIRGEFSTQTSDVTFLDNVSLPCGGSLCGPTPDPSCPADTNGDGAVSPADFNAWIIAFNDQCPACDQNGDGQCSPADFNAWIINFNNGCP